MASFSIRVMRTFIHAEALSELRRPRSQSLPPGTREFGFVNIDARSGITAPTLKRNETVRCLPQQPKPKSTRPSKAKRERAKKQLAAIERQIAVNPHGMDLDALVLPAFYGDLVQSRIRTYFRTKLEETNVASGDSGGCAEPLVERDEAANRTLWRSKPKQKRPCKAKRECAKKQLKALELEAIDGVDVAGMSLLSCYADLVQGRTEASFQIRLEERHGRQHGVTHV